ncbi:MULTISPECIES: replication initiator protein A [unclassified Ruminococcus]|uniref:replication initiator protein A n=1 Tax=unclassified Ruminococcus TaxID=2608920 RepID=UPI00210E3654|nr:MULTISPECIES: replication initiator protein A [unclassified Ruminococcus]
MFEYFSSVGIEKFTFYRLPKALFTNSVFKDLSCESKILYGLLLDRASVSKKNRWIDENNRVYVHMQQVEVQEMLSIGKGKAVTIFKELESIGLIIRKKLGQGNPTRIYVMNFSSVVPDEVDHDLIDDNFETSTQNSETEVLTSENRKSETSDDFETSPQNGEMEVLTSENRKSEIPDNSETFTQNSETEVLTSKNRKSALPKSESHASYYKSKTNMSKNNLSFYPSADDTKRKSDLRLQKSAQNGMKERQDEYNSKLLESEEAIKEQINYAYLQKRGISVNTLDLIVDILANAYIRTDGDVTINGNTVPISIIKREYKKLTPEHIEYVLDCIDEQSKSNSIRNLRCYLQSTLYNAPHNIDLHYDTMVNFDINNK